MIWPMPTRAQRVPPARRGVDRAARPARRLPAGACLDGRWGQDSLGVSGVADPTGPVSVWRTCRAHR